MTMLKQDALKNKNNMDPAVLEAVRNATGGGPERRFKLVANLPYNIATPILSNLLAWPTRASVADGDDSEGTGRPDLRQPGNEGLQRPEHLDAGPVRRSRSSAPCRRKSSGRGPRCIRRSFISFRTLRNERGLPICGFFHQFVRGLFSASPQVPAGRAGQRS